jgi:Cu+-exporting ATPase
MASLAMFGSSVTILEPLKTPSDTILRISYKPNPPQLTIRHIISAISNAKSPPFQVSIHRPPTVEEVARTLQCRQQRDLLVRLAVTVVIGIPTFVIGIVYMSILGDHNPGKRFFMEPMWVGNASRLEWALLFLATPVMFYSANVFHRRAVKEIRAKWRKGSTTPILQRFTRFGSMNLLVSVLRNYSTMWGLCSHISQVSTGVSVAYFASIALLCLAATQPAPMRDGGMKETDISTYFDSVVFLTMFLLAGEYHRLLIISAS